MPTDDTFTPALAPQRLVSYVDGVGSSAANTNSSVTTDFANALTGAGWELVDLVYANTGDLNFIAWDQLTIDAPLDPILVDKVLIGCSSGDFLNFIGKRYSQCDGDAVYFLPFDPYRQITTETSTCIPFERGTTVSMTIGHFEGAVAQVFGPGWTFVTNHLASPWQIGWNYQLVSTGGGNLGNGQLWATNGRYVSFGQTWGGGYLLRSAASNTGARIYLKITEFGSWAMDTQPIVVLHMDVATSSAGPWHTFSLELTPADNDQCPPLWLGSPLWTYKVIANPYQCFVLGHANKDYYAYDDTCNDGQKALFACGCPWVNTAHSGSIAPAWATGNPDPLNVGRTPGGTASYGTYTGFMRSTFWPGLYSWNGGDFVSDSRAVAFTVPMSISEPLTTRGGNTIAGHTWISFPDPADGRMKIVGKLWDGMYVTSGAYDLQGESVLEGHKVHLISRQQGEDYDHIMNNSLWVIGE